MFGFSKISLCDLHRSFASFVYKHLRKEGTFGMFPLLYCDMCLQVIKYILLEIDKISLI